MSSGRRIAVVSMLFIAFAIPASAWSATADESGFLSLYFTQDELEVFSATRSLKSVATIAENVTVVTAADIELMNAHTVAEALYNVTGIELQDFKGPGSGGRASIHGSDPGRVTVMLDGVPLNNADNEFPLSRLPAAMVAKIEIIEGPASSTWGSSFGGIVNVITKTSAAGERFGGTAYASYGEESTSDLKAELRGGSGRFGFYLFGGAMDSDGVQDGHDFTHQDVLANAHVDAGANSSLDLSLYYHSSDSVHLDTARFDSDLSFGYDLETLHGKADLRTSFAPGVDVNLSAWTLRQDENFYQERWSDEARLRDAPTAYHRYGLRGDLTWQVGRHTIVAGADFMDGRLESNFEPHREFDHREYGLFVNDTIIAGSLCVTPGLRYDHSDRAGGIVSPSLGATWLASRDLLFRAIVSRGFHEPAITKYEDAPGIGYVGNEDLTPEIVWSYQAGVEANVAGLLRAKLTLFYHDIDDVLVDKVTGIPVGLTAENAGKAHSWGGQLELVAREHRGFTFEAGASYEQIELENFSDLLHEPRRDVYGFNGAATYDGGKRFRATLRGHYLWWDMYRRFAGDYDGFIVDANLITEVARRDRLALEVFFTARNIFDAASYSDSAQRNPGRWVEAGVRCSF